MNTVAAMLLAMLLTGATAMMGSVASATSTFIGSTITEIQPDGRRVTIRTVQGENWSLDVASPELMNGISRGDQVSLELDGQDRVRKIVKMGEAGPAAKERSGASDY